MAALKKKEPVRLFENNPLDEAKYRRFNEAVYAISKDDKQKPIHLSLGNSIRHLQNISDRMFYGDILVKHDLGVLLATRKRLNELKISHDKVKFETCSKAASDYAMNVLEINTKLIPYEDLKLYKSGNSKYNYSMKFGLVLANPPYKAGMHLKILEHCIDNQLAPEGEALFLHPSELYVHKRQAPSGKKSKAANKVSLRDKLSKHGTEVEFIDNPWPIGVAVYSPICLTHVTNKGVNKVSDTRTKIRGNDVFAPQQARVVAHLDDVSQWFDGKTEMSFVKKVMLAVGRESWGQHLYKPLAGCNPYYVTLARLVGNGNTDLFFLDGVRRKIQSMYSVGDSSTLIVNRVITYAKAQGKKSVGNVRPWFALDTAIKAQNASDFIMKTKFFRAYTAIMKHDQHADIMYKVIPWLDWTQQWTDTKLNQHFNLSSDEITTIDKIVDAITIK